MNVLIEEHRELDCSEKEYGHVYTQMRSNSNLHRAASASERNSPAKPFAQRRRAFANIDSE